MAGTIDSSSQPVIVLTNLVKFFGRFAALRDISDSFAPGRLYVVVGDNGAGKSTLLRVVAGLMQPSQGSVTLLGSKSARDVAHRIGYMGHAPLLYDELSGMENLRYFGGLYGLRDESTCRNAMQMVGLDPDLARRVGQYSQGMRQRLSLARAVFLNRLGEIRDRSFENQRYRASGLNLVVAAIVLWNTVYLERAIQALRDSGKNVDDKLLQHMSPLGWEHINLTGDYLWRNSEIGVGQFRPLRPLPIP